MSRFVIAFVLSSCLTVGCSDDTLELAVDVRTDMVSGVEFTGVRTTIAGAPIELNASRGDDFVSGIRVAERSGLAAGSYGVTVALLDLDGRVVVERNVQLDLRESFGLTVVITRTCVAIECPAVGGDAMLTTCYAGQCVDPRCGADGMSCPPAECTADSQCTAAGPCARGVCDEGACLSVGDDSMCTAAEYCDPDRGCSPLPDADAGPMDSGVTDSGPADAGMDGDAGMPDAGPSPNIALIAAQGGHVCALDTLGRVFCWGGNDSRQVGVPTPARVLTPFQLTALDTDIVGLAAGGSHSCALSMDGEVQCWGRGDEGQLGDRGTTTISAAPVVVPVTATALVSGGSHLCALDDMGNAICWGQNSEGQLGLGTLTAMEAPTRVPFAGTFLRLAAGGTHTCGVAATGDVHCWGEGTEGQLGLGFMGSTDIPTRLDDVTASVDWQVFAGWRRTCLTRDGVRPLCFGDNFRGALGVGDTMNRFSPTEVSSSTDMTGFGIGQDHMCSMEATGLVQCAGVGADGELGGGMMPAMRTSFAATGVFDGTALHHGKHHTCAIVTGGTVMCWGLNDRGQLGVGTTVGTATPAPVLFP